MRLKLVLLVTMTVSGRSLPAQDSVRVAEPDSVRQSKLHRAATRAVEVGRWSLGVARRGAEIVFDVDSTVERWSLHPDRASATLRALSPVAFWVPIAAVGAEPAIWADEAQDGHTINARYARTATIGLGIGFVLSRATKHFVHRPRPCSGAKPNGRPGVSDSSFAPACTLGVSARTSFFSEHTMALFAIASATSFQAQRQQAANATELTAITFTAASVFAAGRVYQHHHWLSDVLAGAVVGTASGFLAAQLTPAVRRAR